MLDLFPNQTYHNVDAHVTQSNTMEGDTYILINAFDIFPLKLNILTAMCKYYYKFVFTYTML